MSREICIEIKIVKTKYKDKFWWLGESDTHLRPPHDCHQLMRRKKNKIGDSGNGVTRKDIFCLCLPPK